MTQIGFCGNASPAGSYWALERFDLRVEDRVGLGQIDLDAGVQRAGAPAATSSPS